MTIEYTHDETEAFVLKEIDLHFIRFSSPGTAIFFYDCPEYIQNRVNWTPESKILDDKNDAFSSRRTNRFPFYFSILFGIALLWRSFE